MNERTRNEITSWLLDRVAQGEHEEEGSFDLDTIGRGFGKTEVLIQKTECGYDVTIGSWSSVSDFSLTQKSTESDIRRLIAEY